MSKSSCRSVKTINRRHYLKTLVSTVSYAALAPRLFANESRSLSYQPLFDGVSLDGWHTNSMRIGHGTGGLWRVENGAITGRQDPPGSGNGGLLLSNQPFGDFDLLIEMRPDWGPDSGVFFRCTETGAGFQMYVDYHDGGNVGHLRGEMPGAFAIKPFQIDGKFNDRGKLIGFTTRTDPRAEQWPEGVYEYTCSPDQWRKAWRIDDWNTARIRCIGKYPQITTWINDVKICHFDGEACTLPGYGKQHVYDLLGRSGSIGLQVHGGDFWPAGKQCRWKNIRIARI
jgi:hypothetical protein